MACRRQPIALPPELIAHTLALTDDEKAAARTGAAAVTVNIRAHHRNLLRDRKRLLFWLRALMQGGGVVAIDESSMLCWSQAMLDDELAHDADLDIESLYTIHAVQDAADSTRVSWLHTHGLKELKAFDIDVLQPSPMFVANCGDPMRALAFAALEGAIARDVDRFPLVLPGGDVRLVPVDRFHAEASSKHSQLREVDAAHGGRRSVVCEPVGGLLGRWRTRPVPSKFFSRVDSDQMVVPFSSAATALMSERAKHTFSVFRALKEEFAGLDLPTVVKLGYEMEGGSPGECEHLWFAVHQVLGDTVDATLANAPHCVPSLTAGQRGEFELERLTDWMILSPEGPMTPRNVSASRRLRVNRSRWQGRIDAEKRSS